MKEGKDEKEISRPSSSFIVDKKLWKKVWNLQVPNKIKNFLWRLCINSLATNMNLYKRKVRQDPVYSIYRNEEETIEHLYFTCDWTALVWFARCYGLRCRKEDIGRIDERLDKMFSGKDIDMVVKKAIAWTCWYLWKEKFGIQMEQKKLNRKEQRIKRSNRSIQRMTR